MAVLDQGMELTERPGEGRFFVPAGLDNLRAEVVARTDALRKLRTKPGPMLERAVSAFEEKFLAFDQVLTDARAETAAKYAFQIVFPRQMVAHSNAYNRLVTAYEIRGAEDSVSVVVPTSAVDVHRLLRHPDEGDYNYRPVVDMRVHTSTDPVIQIYAVEGLQDLPSAGRWYRLPLDCVSIEVVPEL